MLVVLLCILAFAMLALGFEMLLVMGAPALLAKAAFHGGMPDVIIPQKIMGGVNVGTLLAIPYFIFAAELMAHGVIAQRLTAMVRTLVGHYPGGVGHTAVGSCMAFGAVCGSAPATVAALGRLCFPELQRAGYSEKFSLGLIASSAECALLIPPSITMIIYGWITGTSIAALFAGGLVVGIVLGVAFMALVQWETWRTGARRGAPWARDTGIGSSRTTSSSSAEGSRPDGTTVAAAQMSRSSSLPAGSAAPPLRAAMSWPRLSATAAAARSSSAGERNASPRAV
jgi:tripartite ATP-independent transporter DctM subunit